jgi:hypothetical protein
MKEEDEGKKTSLTDKGEYKVDGEKDHEQS